MTATVGSLGDSTFYVGLARGMMKEPGGDFCFGNAGGSCGLFQASYNESSRLARTNSLGTRSDSDDDKLLPTIKAGSRIVLQLSKSDGSTRRLRIRVDRTDAATFQIPDNAEGWVAGALTCPAPALCNSRCNARRCRCALQGLTWG